ncbi:MAG: hypothetical protein ABSE17_04620 [Candidatus Levyibacteriota bacterium]|jgi:hypothetical protein
MEDVTLDRVDKIIVSSDKFHNEISTLNYLKFGLLSLAGNTREIELELNKNSGLVFSFGTHMGVGLDARKTAILACFYHWYANSIYNYVRLIRYAQGINENLGIIINPYRRNKNRKNKILQRLFE